jgi:hypothetical protein
MKVQHKASSVHHENASQSSKAFHISLNCSCFRRYLKAHFNLNFEESPNRAKTFQNCLHCFTAGILNGLVRRIFGVKVGNKPENKLGIVCGVYLENQSNVQ